MRSAKLKKRAPGSAYRLAIPETVQLELNKTVFYLTVANTSTHDMRFGELLKTAPYTQNHASEVAAATSDTHGHGNAPHWHNHVRCGHARPKITRIRQHATEHDHPTGYKHTPTARGVLESQARPKTGAHDDAHACRASISIGKLNGARVALGRRLAGQRFRFEAYRSSSRPPSSFWQRMRDSTTSL